MAEPTNTPMPPGTPIPAGTPRSSSPAPPHHPHPLQVQLLLQKASGIASPILTSPTTASIVVPTPTSAVLPSPAAPEGFKPRVLHIGDPCKYNLETYAAFSTQCEIVRPSTPERERDAFAQALRERKWGEFAAIFRPFWGSGGEMGQWDEELIALLPQSVKVFASAGAGFDWADTKLLGERGIIYCNSGLAAAEAVADFAVAMIISTFRHLPWCMTAATSKDPARFRDCHGRATTVSNNLRGQVLALVGLGNIGQQIAFRCGKGFLMDIHYYDVERKSAAVEADLGATYHPSLESLLREADCVVLCTPAAGNAKVINAESLAWFKPGARFVNIARGSLVDEEALVAALEEGRVSAAAADVHEKEPTVHPRLVEMAGDRVFLSCHNAGGTVQTHIGFEELSMRNVMAVLSGGEPITPVNLQYLQREK